MKINHNNATIRTFPATVAGEIAANAFYHEIINNPKVVAGRWSLVKTNGNEVAFAWKA